MLMGMFTKETGRKTKLTVLENTIILMVQSMRVIGEKINSMVMEKKHGLMELATRVSIKKVKKMGMENSYGLTVRHIKDNLWTIIYME